MAVEIGAKHALGLVLPTKDREATLSRLLESIARQSVLPSQVIIVDAGAGEPPDWAGRFPSLNVRRVRASRAGLTRQKNQGVALLIPEISLVGFIDDDIVLEDGAIERMLRFWDRADAGIGGAAFNIVTPGPVRSPLVRLVWRMFQIHDGSSGRLLPSGFNTPITGATETCLVDWVNGGSTVWRRAIVERFAFDEWFERNALCEDLHYSVQVAHACRVGVVADARVAHLECDVTRRAHYLRGRDQVVNRLYVVRTSPRFSPGRCCWALIGQFLLNAVGGIASADPDRLARALGNVTGAFEVVTGRAFRAGT